MTRIMTHIEDRREDKRIDLPLTIGYMMSGIADNAHICNISKHGVCMFFLNPVKPGDKVTIFSEYFNQEDKSHKGIVKWSEKLTDSNWIAGIQIERPSA